MAIANKWFVGIKSRLVVSLVIFYMTKLQLKPPYRAGRPYTQPLRTSRDKLDVIDQALQPVSSVRSITMAGPFGRFSAY